MVDIENDTKPAGPCALVIFGASGDLTKRLLIPAIYNLRCAGLLSEDFVLIGVARRDTDDAFFQNEVRSSIDQFAEGTTIKEHAEWLASRAHYMQGNLDDSATYTKLSTYLTQNGAMEKTGGNCLFYLATPAEVFATIVHKLGEAGLMNEEEGKWRRIVIEKPFGHDLKSAEDLNKELLSVVPEQQIYRIDHYLGKETVQNILAFRFGNSIFEPLWNRHYIDHVQITVAETLGVEKRGKFYEATGALRDMVPNHLSQLLTLIAMEPPASFDAEVLRNEKAKVLKAIHPLSPDDVKSMVVRAQYNEGVVKEKKVIGYKEAEDVDSNSRVETYVAMKVMVDNWRWAGVPFYMRTGKAMSARKTEIAIRFKRAPLALFRDTGVEKLTHNDLVIQVQPDEGVTLRIGAKVPGPNMRISGVEMKFNYTDYFKATAKTGYETLIYDCMIGDATLFQRADNIEAGWRMVQPILDAWANDKLSKLPSYTAGSAGPDEAVTLMAKDDRHWRKLEPSKSGKTS